MKVDKLLNMLAKASSELDKEIILVPRLIHIGKPPEYYLSKARNLLQAAITNVLLAWGEDDG